VYVSMYAGLCHALRRRLRLRLNSDLCLYPSRKLLAALDRSLFEKSFQQLFQKSFA
jgi:hypothetical protein